MISRIQEEIAEYEAARVSTRPVSKNIDKLDDPDTEQQSKDQN
jgi:hypothetical protein